VLLRVLVSGKKDSIETTYEYEMTTYKDRVHHITAMARATASTISIVAQMIGEGTIHEAGVYPPEKIVPGDIYIEELRKRDVHILESNIRENSPISSG